MASDGIKYTPSKTVRDFMLSDHSFRALMGPYGSGKTSGAIMELLRQSIMMPRGADGLRQSRMLIVRSTKPQLKDNTLVSVLELLPESIYKWRESEWTMRFNFNDVRSDWLFRSLDTPEDRQRVLGLQVSWVWIDEARELPVALLPDLEGRSGRFPSQGRSDAFPEGFRYRSGLLYTTNPPEIDDEHYKLLEHLPQVEDEENSIIDVATFIQPSGLSPEAENIENLRPGYYENMAKGKPQNWVDVYVHGKYAKSQSGRPVYEKSFNPDKRVRGNQKIDPFLPVVVGIDSARQPAAVFMQLGLDGRLRKLKEATGFDMGFKTFLAYKLQPLIKMYFSMNPLIFVGDPSWTRQNDTDDNSIRKLLKKTFVTDMPGAGNTVKSAVTNDPVARINALDEPFRNLWPDGEPGIIYDPDCKLLVEGLRSKYRYVKQKTTDGKYKDTPDKNKWSHVVEADQYGTLYILSPHYRPSEHQRDTQRYGTNVEHVDNNPADSYTGY
jgi:hypothetical protein